jgi:hypothetical protein
MIGNGMQDLINNFDQLKYPIGLLEMKATTHWSICFLWESGYKYLIKFFIDSTWNIDNHEALFMLKTTEREKLDGACPEESGMLQYNDMNEVFIHAGLPWAVLHVLRRFEIALLTYSCRPTWYFEHLFLQMGFTRADFLREGLYGVYRGHHFGAGLRARHPIMHFPGTWALCGTGQMSANIIFVIFCSDKMVAAAVKESNP